VGPLTSTPHHVRHAVVFEEDVGATRRAVARMVAPIPAVEQADVELVVTELATNIVRHALAGGYVLARPLEAGVELVAVDHGSSQQPAPVTPRSVAAWSLAPTRGLGVGLATVERLATTFDLYATSAGTVVLARLGDGDLVGNGRCAWGGVNVPRTGESVSGDAWTVVERHDGTLLAVLVDGLGHGPAAAVAATAAISEIEGSATLDLDALLERISERMRPTRGGVIGIAVVDPATNEVSYVGVGNVSACVVSDATRHLASRDGVVGGGAPRPKSTCMRTPWTPNAVLVLASDGVRAHWDFPAFPGLLGHDPVVVAATLLRDHERGTDDAAVLVVQDRRR
jgi:anti-sigma regulatory factor (Ser/Thr protein kinase)